jgi:hypothetical protein
VHIFGAITVSANGKVNGDRWLYIPPPGGGDANVT